MDLFFSSATLDYVHVVLRKLTRGSLPVVGRLVRPPRLGAVLVIEIANGTHEYITTPARRVFRLAGENVWFVETANSKYRIEFHETARSSERATTG